MKERAIQFATEAHGDQARKYCGSPYITHPIAVAKIVESVEHTEEMVVAAILHDVVEDTPVRAHRKQLDAEHNSKGPAGAQTIKVADLIHNSSDIVVQDPKFWKTYKIEKLNTLNMLDKADPVLKERAMRQIMGSK